MLKLASALTSHLLGQPESGMGYQIVEATLFDDKIKRGVVYNAELLLFEEEPRVMLQTAAYSRLLEEARTSAGEVKTVRVLQRPGATRLATSVMEAQTSYAQKARPAKDAPPEKTKPDEVFKRFSAYENDRRVLPNRSLLPGTYATTEEDARNVNAGKEAVARYALPNPKPASYVFTISPEEDTVIQRGVVEPANGQPGGGVEVIFTTGTQKDTVAGPEKIPDE